MSLTEPQEGVAQNLDTLGLGLIGAGVLGHVLTHHAGPSVNPAWAAEHMPGVHASMLGRSGPLASHVPPEALSHAPGIQGALGRLGGKLEGAGPYLDIAGLGLIAPPVLNRAAKAVKPEEPSKIASQFYRTGCEAALRQLGVR